MPKIRQTPGNRIISLRECPHQLLKYPPALLIVLKHGSFGKFQPSEISKICVLLLTAYIVKLSPRRLNHIGGFIRVLTIMAPLIILVVWENFSTALVMGVMMVAICFVATRNKKYYIVIALALVAAAILFIVLFPYRLERINIWRDIENHPKGYQILQGLYAIASGGLISPSIRSDTLNTIPISIINTRSELPP